MKEYSYKTVGTCSREIIIQTEDDIIVSAKFIGGCPGNTQGVCALVKGRKIDDVIALLEGITCGPKPTSCPDQLAKALKQLKNS